MGDYIYFVLAPQMLNGLALGVSVIFVALGLTIIFGLLDVINMSHGEFYAIGAFGALALSLTGMNYWVLIASVPILMVPLGVITERYLIRRVYDGADRHVSTLLLTFGLGLIVEDVLKILFGPNTQRPENPLPGATDLFGIYIPTYRLFLIAIGAIWDRVHLGPALKKTAFGLFLFGTTANWATVFLAAAWGASALMPIAGAGHTGSPFQENTVAILLLVLSVAMIFATALMLLGLLRKRA